MINELFHVDKMTRRTGTAGELSTGLGLLLCKEFVEMHHGKISVKSEINKGTEFVVSLS